MSLNFCTPDCSDLRSILASRLRGGGEKQRGALHNIKQFIASSLLVSFGKTPHGPYLASSEPTHCVFCWGRRDSENPSREAPVLPGLSQIIAPRD
jgi:hypothetical protein